MVANDEEYINKLKERTIERDIQNRLTKAGGCCPLCGELQDPREMEDHHIAGRLNSDITVPVCYSCHRKLSDRQRRWPKVWTRQHNPSEVKKVIMKKGLGDVMKLVEINLRRLDSESGGKED